MTLGIQCLLADNMREAQTIAQTLQDLNVERRNIEADMQDEAFASLQEIDVQNRYSLSMYQPGWHQGVVGILASRLKEKYHRPTIAFADAGEGVLKGSGRSVPSLHLRDALDLVSKRHPELILKFGGHAMAAGLSIREVDFDEFSAAFEQALRELMTKADLEAVLETDGSLDSEIIDLETAWMLVSQAWGQGFPQPVFSDDFKVIQQRVLKEKHLKLWLEKDGKQMEAMHFNFAENVSGNIRVAYALEVNEFNGTQRVQLLIKHLQS